MDPSTAKINASGGIITITTLVQNVESNLPLNGTGGAALGFNLAYTKTYNMYNPTNTRPGNNAPRNISPALVEPTLSSPGILNSPVTNL